MDAAGLANANLKIWARQQHRHSDQTGIQLHAAEHMFQAPNTSSLQLREWRGGRTLVFKINRVRNCGSEVHFGFQLIHSKTYTPVAGLLTIPCPVE